MRFKTVVTRGRSDSKVVVCLSCTQPAWVQFLDPILFSVFPGMILEHSTKNKNWSLLMWPQKQPLQTKNKKQKKKLRESTAGRTLDLHMAGLHMHGSAVVSWTLSEYCLEWPKPEKNQKSFNHGENTVLIQSSSPHSSWTLSQITTKVAQVNHCRSCFLRPSHWTCSLVS